MFTFHRRNCSVFERRRHWAHGSNRRHAVAGAGDHGRALEVHHGSDGPTRKTEDLLLGTWELLGQLGRVPRRLIWDHEPGIGRGQRRSEGAPTFMGTLATKLVLLPPKDPESKGLVERRNGWFDTSFMPGRTFRSPGDFNDQFTDWLARANARVVRTIKVAPVDLIEADRAAMLPLPPIPLHLGWRNRIRLGRDYYVRIDTCDYSVDPTVIGRLVDVCADLERVKVRAEGRVVPTIPGCGLMAPPSPTRSMSRPPPGCANSSNSPAVRPLPATTR